MTASERIRDTKSYRYLITGSPRWQLADALTEYRAFIRDNPRTELAETLARVCWEVRQALKEAREIERAIGWGGKVNARCDTPEADRRKMQRDRKIRLQAQRLAA